MALDVSRAGDRLDAVESSLLPRTGGAPRASFASRVMFVPDGSAKNSRKRLVTRGPRGECRARDGGDESRSRLGISSSASHAALYNIKRDYLYTFSKPKIYFTYTRPSMCHKPTVEKDIPVLNS